MDDDMANLIVAQLLYLDSADPHRDVTLYVNSPGGSVTAGERSSCIAWAAAAAAAVPLPLGPAAAAAIPAAVRCYSCRAAGRSSCALRGCRQRHACHPLCCCGMQHSCFGPSRLSRLHPLPLPRFHPPGMAVFDTMRHIRPDVSTVCVGLAASMGAFLLASGHQGKRYSLPNSRIMIHQPLGGAQGQAADIEIQVGVGAPVIAGGCLSVNAGGCFVGQRRLWVLFGQPLAARTPSRCVYLGAEVAMPHAGVT